jgi:hypothetical protein
MDAHLGLSTDTVKFRPPFLAANNFFHRQIRAFYGIFRYLATMNTCYDPNGVVKLELLFLPLILMPRAAFHLLNNA